jgi:hypothetical protein
MFGADNQEERLPGGKTNDFAPQPRQLALGGNGRQPCCFHQVLQRNRDAAQGEACFTISAGCADSALLAGALGLLFDFRIVPFYGSFCTRFRCGLKGMIHPGRSGLRAG